MSRVSSIFAFPKRTADSYPTAVGIITWTLRVIVGGLFIFSGFSKAIDVWGTFLKFNEYFGALGYEVWEGLNLSLVFILCLVEFITGFFLLFGCFRKATPWIALLIMAVMLPLTLWLAVKNPISDCGCFGDAFKVSNWTTFYKNLLLTVGILWLLLFNRRAVSLINPYLQWIGAVAAGVYLLLVAWIGYYYQPLIDFRQYKVGTELVNIENDDSLPAGDEEMRFVYEKDDVRKEFTIDDELPDEDEGWEFVERYEVGPDGGTAKTAVGQSKEGPEKNLRFFSENGLDDMTEQVIGNGRQLILMIPKLSEVTPAKSWKINSLYKWAKQHDIDMLATVGGNPMEIQQWKDISLAEYPIYTSDDTSIEEVVRGNPGIIYVEDGVIRWKSTLNAISIDDFQKGDIGGDPMYFAHDNRAILSTLTWSFVIVIILLVLLSVSPWIYNGIRYLIRKRRGMEPGGMRLRMPAEWEGARQILITMPSKDTDWAYIIDEATRQFEVLAGTVADAGEKVLLVCDGNVSDSLKEKLGKRKGTVITDVPYNDTWTRDYGSITVEDHGKFYELDFGFNGWGLKFASDKDNLVNLHLVEKGYRKDSHYRNERDFTLEGGSIESDGRGTLLTTSKCLCSPNRNGGKSKEEIEAVLKEKLGAQRVLWLDYGFLEGDDTDSHIDTLARLAPNDTILYVAPPEDRNDIHHKELKSMETQLREMRTKGGKPYRLLALPFPDAIFDEDGNRLPATYANYLVTNRNLFIPTYSQPQNDRKAVETIGKAFPNHRIFTVDCSTLIKQHGSLHCSTMQLYL